MGINDLIALSRSLPTAAAPPGLSGVGQDPAVHGEGGVMVQPHCGPHGHPRAGHPQPILNQQTAPYASTLLPPGE